MKHLKSILYATITLIVLLNISLVIVSAQPPTVTINPQQPYPQSTATFTANVPEIEVTNIYIVVQECNGKTGICYPDEQNSSMTQKSASSYESTITLKHNDATYIQYTLVVKNDQGWTKYLDLTKVYLSEKPSNNNGSSDSPGFEFIGLTFSIMFILLIIYKRRR